MSKIAIFASGEGSNADQIIRFCNLHPQKIKVELIVCNKKEAGIYNIAKKHQIPILYVKNSSFESGEAVVDLLIKRGIEWIVLAGFLRKIPMALLRAFPNKIINIHPSLLPKYGGKGMYGNFVHQAVIEAQENESGISIHLVNEEFDKGELIAQYSCSLDKNEELASLKQKIQKLEHEFYPKVIYEYISSKN